MPRTWKLSTGYSPKKTSLLRERRKRKRSARVLAVPFTLAKRQQDAREIEGFSACPAHTFSVTHRSPFLSPAHPLSSDMAGTFSQDRGLPASSHPAFESRQAFLYRPDSPASPVIDTLAYSWRVL